MGSTVNTIKHVMTADHSRYDTAMTKSANNTKRMSNSSRDLVASIALIDGPLGGVASRASNLNSLLTSGGVAFAAFAASVSAVGFATVKMLKTISQVEVEMGKTEAILRSTGNASGFLAAELDDMARRQARATLASTDEMRKAINSLLTFTSIGNERFEDVISLSQDMASIWGGSAATNARKLGKALDDPIKQISRLETTVGAFRAEQREMILDAAKSGDKFQAQALIIQALEERIGNAGEGAGQGLAGAVDLLGQEWDELFEAIDRSTGSGARATSYINALATAMNELSNAISPDDQQKQLDLQYRLIQLKGELSVLEAKSNGSGVERRAITNLRADIFQTEQELSSVTALLNKKDEQIAKTREEGKAKRALAEQEKLDKKENKLLDDLIFTGQQEAFKLAAKRGQAMLKELEKEEAAKKRLADVEKARVDSLTSEVNGIRDSGLDALELEIELHDKNIAKLTEYRDLVQDKARIDEVIAAERRRTLAAQNDAVFEERNSTLSISLGDAEEEINFDDELEQHASRVAKIMEFRELDVRNHKASMEQLEKEQERHSEAISRIDEFELQQRHQARKDFFNNASSLMNSQSRKLFEIGKTAAISNAIVSATESIPHAYKWGTKIGGPVLGAAFAATAIAATTAQIQAINDTSFGSKSVATSAGASAPSIADTAQQNNTGNVEIHFNGDVSGLDAEVLADTLKDYIDQTDYILVDRASRNGQELLA